jgi:hypothetical protein
MMRHRGRGQAMTEYLLIMSAWLLVLFVLPWGPGGKSIFLTLVDYFDVYLNSFHSVLSLPIP